MCIYIYIYIYVRVYIYIYIYIHTHTHTLYIYTYPYILSRQEVRDAEDPFCVGGLLGAEVMITMI